MSPSVSGSRPTAFEKMGSFSTVTAGKLLLVSVTILLHIHPMQGRPSQCSQIENVTASLGCSCESAFINNIEDSTKVVINCRGKQLHQLPAINGSFNGIIYEYILADNNLQSIPDAAFRGLKLQKLDLRTNPLTSINKTAFLGLENDLQVLQLASSLRSNVGMAFNAVNNLTRLQNLTLEYFRFPGNIFHNLSIYQLSSIQTLILRYNELERAGIDNDVLPSDLTTLVLDHQSLTALPLSIHQLSKLTHLSITNTNISEISTSAFDGISTLQTLDLSHNKIKTIEKGGFSGTNLLMLSLKNNPIENHAVVLNELQPLTGLSDLDLSYINLPTLAGNVGFLQNKNRLAHLSLEGNFLTNVDANVFDAVGSSLTYLSLAYNQISTMGPTALMELTALEVLDLSNQAISPANKLSLPSLSSTANKTLQTLILSGTPIDENNLWGKVKTLTSLHTLRADNTTITRVQDLALRDLTQLTELSLGSNFISEITQSKFVGPRNLTKLYLNNNSISEISYCAFYQYIFNPPLELMLYGNNLNCDCKLKWLLEARNNHQITLLDTVMCAAPADKAGQPMISLTPDQFTCNFAFSNPPCDNYYTTTWTITVLNTTVDSIKVRWTVNNYPNINYFTIESLELGSQGSELKVSGNISSLQNTYLIQGLHAGHTYSICVTAYNTAGLKAKNCTVNSTMSAYGESSNLKSEDTAAIIGAVVGSVVAVVIIGVIVFIVCKYRKRSTAKADVPEQPHTFSPSELPSMGTDTKSFTRPKDKPPRVGRALDHDTRVNVISDGKVNGTTPNAAIHAGSYIDLNQKHIQNQNSARSYEGKPQAETNGYYAKGSYYNKGFQKEEVPHEYHEITI